MKIPVKFRVRRALKDYLKHAVKQDKKKLGSSAAEIVRRSIDVFLAQRPMSPLRARALVNAERYARPSDACIYDASPWATIKVNLEPDALESLRKISQRSDFGIEELVRGILFDQLSAHYRMPEYQLPTDEERGYSELMDEDGITYLDPRHPENRGREREAAEHLDLISSGPHAGTELLQLEFDFRQFIRRLRIEHQRFEFMLPENKE